MTTQTKVANVLIILSFIAGFFLAHYVWREKITEPSKWCVIDNSKEINISLGNAITACGASGGKTSATMWGDLECYVAKGEKEGIYKWGGYRWEGKAYLK